MIMPFYVPPEQLVKDRAEYARKGIARGRSIVAMEYRDGVVILGENPSGTLHKISEVYDRIAFAGAGKFNEYEMLRKAGIRHADLMGYLYSREDVRAIGLANAFSQTLGSIFTHEMKPYEVEILVAEVGRNGDSSRLFKITYDGTLFDERGVCAIGGQSEALTATLSDLPPPAEMTIDDALRRTVDAFLVVEDRAIEGWEGAALERADKGRGFRRLGEDELAGLAS